VEVVIIRQIQYFSGMWIFFIDWFCEFVAWKKCASLVGSESTRVIYMLPEMLITFDALCWYGEPCKYK
jgi:hypothetical protein